MQSQRRLELINATLESVALHGLQNSTIITISKLAGMSSGIISHYFGGKQGLIEATIKHLLEQLKQALLEGTRDKNLTATERLFKIVEANFTQLQRTASVYQTWLCFWAQAMHDPALARLQHINSARLYSNLRYSFAHLLPKEQATIAAKQTAAMIDGFWLRSALSVEPTEAFSQAEHLCKCFIENLLQQHGDN
ncbi:transcriptional regulator BetI [Thalassomonas actiniarum]|uniref:HTH-type transcriptional regulator BetI n=1 Tax=Thalassomonas actiniarum TaxID=485447 RepID=A0AAF0C6A3_9GAMM|nr:transcriptional regulator BetI [Thalassomonas actiniarum]WDE01815.1 transcriptional regulator BetI [Thalassomonas actiniarum]